jgi:hypothetical protein
MFRRRRRTTESPAAARLRRRTRALGVFAVGSVVALIGAEFARVWRLGSLPLERGDETTVGQSQRSARQVAQVLREGYRVSSTRQNALLNMVVAYAVTFGTVRWITYTIRVKGGIGPIRDINVGGRHIHHFIPGAAIAFVAGGYSLAANSPEVDRWLAIPYGVGIALVLDETALLLQLEDVYWSEEGVLSVQIALLASCLLAALAYLIRMVARGEMYVRETDWETAARAWDDLKALGRT